MASKIIKIHQASFALNEINDGLRDPSSVKAILAVGDDFFECVRKVG